MKIIYFRGDVLDVSAKKEALLMRWCGEVLGISYDVKIKYKISE